MTPPKKPVTTFSDDDASYQAQIARAKAEKVPIGNVPMPAIPRLDGPNPDRYDGVQQRSNAAMDRLLTPQERERLMKDGNFREGAGSAFAANQPGLRAGAVEAPPVSAPPPSGSFANPPRPAGSGLSQNTVDALAAVATANKPVSKTVTPEEEAELEKTVEEVEDLSDGWITDEFGNRVRNLLNNKERRAAIEKRCAPMRVADLFLHNEVRQKVPIIPSQFEPVYRSAGGHEDLFVKRRLSRMTGSDQLIGDTYALMNLVLGLYAINGTLLPSHLDTAGDPQDQLFDVKYNQVSRMAHMVLADLSTNYVWFTRRVSQLLIIDDVKGF